MADEFKIEVHKRELSNKKSYLKNMRKEEKITGIYYSFDSKNSASLFLEKKSFIEAGKSGAKIFNIAVGKDKRTVIFKNIQYHPVTDEILHVDLYGVDMKRAVVVKVLIQLTGNATGVTNEGGILVQSLNEIEIQCLPSDIPDDLEIDITSLAIGDVIKVDDIKVTSELEIKTSPEQTIASVTHAMKEETVVKPEEDEDFIDGESEETSVEDSKKEASDGNAENNEG